jgi:hypothetical protein
MSTRIKYMGATPSPGLRNYPLKLWDWLVGASHPSFDSRRHLDATMDWIARAQDQGGDDGVARMYHLRKGWGASYPETTGYIIPTCFVYAEYSGRREFADRAVRMARWEAAVQMPEGAVQGGVITAAPTPAIFNTGQVLFGWRAAYRHAADEAFKRAAVRAADYLVAQMDTDGAWRKNLSAFTSTNLDTYAYNVRSAWALALAQDLVQGSAYRDAAARNVEFVLTLCRENGWIAKNCLGRPEQPLLHTIAYAYQGLLECSVLLDLGAALDVVLRGNAALLRDFEEQGQLHGRYADCWSPTVHWRCLTGEAQTSIVWQRLAQVTGDRKWSAAAERLNTRVKKTQQLAGPPEKAGGVKGSYPITSPYGALEYLNWAAKFFADALLLELGAPRAALDG